ncbi:MAG: hypothetical protein ACR2H1_07465, partial [Limisphaerales bacterium]
LTLDYLVFACIGFVGVFVPTFILPRSSRVFCAIFLLFLGISYYRLVVGHWRLPDIFSLLLGGLIAIIIHYFCSRPKKADGV